MTKIYFKLIAMAMALVLSVSVLIMSSYAWMVLSGNPAVSGIQVAIGGGNTILVAPDIKIGEGSEAVHYPGFFSDKLNFGTSSSYEYLNGIGGLTPVSTSNGIDWFLSDTRIDFTLDHANISSDEKEKISKGNYIYLDFWVVSPSGDYKLRVSTGDENPNGGSFVIDLLEPIETEEGWSLTEPEGSAAAAIRIGFLANEYQADTAAMLAYQNTHAYDKRYTALRGIYSEPDTGATYGGSVFTIYEPNADYHPGKPELEGKYAVTEYKSMEDHPYDIENHITAQLKSSWMTEGKTIGGEFATAAFGKVYDGMEPKEVMSQFYRGRLQGQIAPYVQKGDFVKTCKNLGDGMDLNGGTVELGGATNDVSIIMLEQNKPQRIRMFIWLEGKDIDCEASAASAKFAVNIEFAGESVGNE